MPKTPRSPYDVKISAEQREELTKFLSDELDRALAVRSVTEAETAYFHLLYEQGRTRGANNSPWPDAADLTSAIGTEKVDTMQAFIMESVFSDTICTVEGWGDAATRAPFVEEFHQWQAELEGFQSAFSNAVKLSLIEPYGMLEVYEERIKRPVRKTINALLALGPDGAALIDENMKPVLQQNPDGSYIEAQPPMPAGPGMPPPLPLPSAEVVIDSYEMVCNGPREREIPYRDCLILPNHARSKQEIWGYAKRFYRRVDELKERANQGIYNADAVNSLGDTDERASETTLSGQPIGVPQKDDDLAELELWEITFLKALDKTGLRWWVATIHKDHPALLRLQYDDIGRPRYFPLRPYPRPASVEGYSLIGHKLITTIEENTAWRNMAADRGSMEVQAPLKRKLTAYWDPDEEPFGPKAVITVREMDEVQPMELPSQTRVAMEHINYSERQGERLTGVTDLSAGVTPSEDRTLGEREMQQSFGSLRTKEVVRNILEVMEDIYQVRHLMWERAIREQPDGMELPGSVLKGLETRGADVTQFLPNRKLTADMMVGPFRFKPKGSVENADKGKLRQDFAMSMQAIGQLSQMIPMIGMVMQNPQAAKAMLEQWVRLFNVQDKQAFLGSEAMMVMQPQSMMGAAPMGATLGPVPPGAPVGQRQPVGPAGPPPPGPMAPQPARPQ